MSMDSPPRSPTATTMSEPRLRRLSSSETRKKKDEALVAAAAASSAPPNSAPPLAELFVKAEPALQFLAGAINVIGPAYVQLLALGVRVYEEAPLDLIQAASGLGLCFFGGGYCASIAAVEAFRQMGWQRTWADLKVVYAELRLVYDRSEEDDLLEVVDAR